jgi:hypothetical protein
MSALLVTVGHWCSLGGEVQFACDPNHPTLQLRLGMPTAAGWYWAPCAVSLLELTAAKASSFDSFIALVFRGAAAGVWKQARPNEPPITWPEFKAPLPHVAPLTWEVTSDLPHVVRAVGIGGTSYTVVGPSEGRCYLSVSMPTVCNTNAAGGVPYADRHAAMKAANQMHADEVRKWL